MGEAGADVDDFEGGPGWSVGLPLAGAGAVQFAALFVLRDFIEPGNWGLFLLAGTASILPLGLALWFGFFRTRDPAGWWKIPSVLWPVSLLGLYTGVAVPDRVQPEFSRPVVAMDAYEYRRAGERIAQGASIVATRPRAVARAVPAPGDRGEIERIRFEFERQMAADAGDYAAALAAAGYPTLLGQIRTPSDLPAARRKIDAVQALIRTYRARYEERLGEVERRLMRAPLSEEARQAVLDGFRFSIRFRRDSGLHIWQLERDKSEAHRGMIDALREGRWQRRGERFVFPDAREQARFDTRLGDVHGAELELAAIREQVSRQPGSAY